jgi:hypothetical protein
MQPTEAMQHLLSLADHQLKNLDDAEKHNKPEHEDFQTCAALILTQREQLSTATAVVTAMLNTALPVARYRVFVEVAHVHKKMSDLNAVTVGEYTLCGVNMSQVKNGLAGLYAADADVRITVFEQRADGADMVEGYEGFTRSHGYRAWYRNLGNSDKSN